MEVTYIYRGDSLEKIILGSLSQQDKDDIVQLNKLDTKEWTYKYENTEQSLYDLYNFLKSPKY